MPRAQSCTRKQLAERASLAAEDFSQINQFRREYDRLGFAYQVGFVRVMNRFPVADALEIIDELLVRTGVQLQLDPERIEVYCQRQETVSAHQVRIREYLGLQRLEGETQQRISPLKCWLGRTMRGIRLPELLLEVANAIGFRSEIRESSAPAGIHWC